LEKLLGKGDMLFMTAEISKPRRIQGAYVTDEEIKAIVDFVKDKAEPEYRDEITIKATGTIPGFNGGGGDMDDDLTMEAKEVILRAGKASATLLQRRLRVGYARAARLLDILEEMGIVGPAEGSKPREVLVKQEDLEENFSSTLDSQEIDEPESVLDNGGEEEEEEDEEEESFFAEASDDREDEEESEDEDEEEDEEPEEEDEDEEDEGDDDQPYFTDEEDEDKK